MDKSKKDISFNISELQEGAVQEKVDREVKLSKNEIADAKCKYGMFNGYPKLQLAFDYFQMSNDLFFEVYGFNFVPKGKLYTEAKSMIETRQMANNLMNMYSEASAFMHVSATFSEFSHQMTAKESVDYSELEKLAKNAKDNFELGC